MTERKDDGGPAFPMPPQQFTDGVTIVGYPGCDGMSLRDWFAGRALAGLLASSDMTVPAKAATFEEIARHFAETSYVYADAMLAERSKP